MLTLGSLFDGIGGWQLAAIHNGVKPIWSSEIEKFPLAVTKERFPETIQLGDVTKIDGASIPPVDIVCAGSPCQDLSVANGARKGLKGERSGLFVDSIRIVREMRRATGGKYPSWFVWENVPGAFSSNGGCDFQAVLEEIGQTKIPIPEGGKWANAGMVQCDGCDIAWRVIDSQFFGVPQRRRRIFIIGDFRRPEYRRAEVLFEPTCVSGDLESRGEAWETVAGSIEDGIGNASECYSIDHVVTTGGNCTAQGPCYYKEMSPTLKAGGTHAVCLRMRAGKPGGGKGALLSEEQSLTLQASSNDQVLFESHPNDSRVSGPVDTAPTVAARYGTGGNNTPLIMGVDIYNCQQTGEKACSVTTATGIPQGSGPKVMTAVKDDISVLTSFMGTGGNNVPAVIDKEKDEVAYTIPHDERSARFVPDKADPMTHYVNYVAVCGKETNEKVTVLNDQGGGVMSVEEDKVGTLRAETHGHEPLVLESTQNHATITDSGVCPTLSASMGMGGGFTPMVFEPGVASRDGGHIYTDGKSPTLRANPGDNQPAIVYSFDSLSSNSMKSSNPNSGCRPVEVAKTLDTSVPDPSKNQGGIAVVQTATAIHENQNGNVWETELMPSLTTGGGKPAQGFPCVRQSAESTAYCVAGNTIDRKLENGGNGMGAQEELSYTLNTIDRHAVAICSTTGSFMKAEVEKSPTLAARDYKDPNIVTVVPTNQPQGIIQYDVTVPVTVRKHIVDTDGLKNLLRSSLKECGMSRKDIAEKLNTPLTEVEHWFRTDNCFSIPSAEVWFRLKELLGIKTNVYDLQVTEFVEKDCTYDSQNRIYDSRGIAPTITSTDADKTILDAPDKAGTLVAGYYKCWNDNPFDRGYAVCQGKAVDVRNSKEYETNGALQSKASNNLQSNNVVRTNKTVRRLTPRECERLQGLPLVRNYFVVDFKEERITLWKSLENWQESPKINARSVVEICRKKLKRVGSAEKEDSQKTVWFAAKSLLQNCLKTNKPVPVNALTSCEENIQEKHSLKEQQNDACNVAKNLANHHPRVKVDFAQSNAPTSTERENTTTFGEMVQQPTEKLTTSEELGSASLSVFGKEIMQLAKDVGNITTAQGNDLQYTILDLTETAQKQGLLKKILYYCVQNATTLSILTPEQIAVLLLGDEPFTLIDDKSCSDSARYKALGNGMAQPVANWVIQRIVEEVNEHDDGDVDEDTDKGI